MNFKRVQVKTETKIIERTTQTVEIDFDFTQVYDCMYSLSFQLRSPISFQLLFYILKTVAEDNMVYLGKDVYRKFNKEMQEHSNNGISEQSFYNCIKELIAAKIMTKISRGSYFLNPYVLWKDDKNKRVEFIRDEEKSPNGLMYNPKENLKYLKSGECEKD